MAIVKHLEVVLECDGPAEHADTVAQLASVGWVVDSRGSTQDAMRLVKGRTVYRVTLRKMAA